MTALGTLHLPSGNRPFARRRDDTIAGVCGVWMIIGLFLDGWAHRNQKPESFFSPWHGILYSGFTASAVWMLYVARRHHRPGVSLRRSLPVGYGVRSLGVILFGIGAIGDLLWHELIGIEVSVEALLSPTHLLLLSGGLLMAAGPIVSTLHRLRTSEAAAPSWAEDGVAIVTVIFAVSVMQFFLMYLSPFDRGLFSTRAHLDALGIGGPWHANLLQNHGIASIFVFTLTFVAALTWTARNLRVPRGAFLVIVVVPSALQLVLVSFHGVASLLGPLLAAVLAEATLNRISNHVHHPVFALWVGGIVTVLWFGFFAGVRVSGPIALTTPLWTGVPFFAGLLSVLMVLAATRLHND